MCITTETNTLGVRLAAHIKTAILLGRRLEELTNTTDDNGTNNNSNSIRARESLQYRSSLAFHTVKVMQPF